MSEAVIQIYTPTMALIKLAVQDEFDVEALDLISARRARRVARPRQVAMWLARKLTTLSLPQIAAHLGGRDHTTVMHGIGRIDDLMREDRPFAARVELLRHALEWPAGLHLVSDRAVA